MGILKSWYGASLQGQDLTVVRSSRGLTGQISHSEISTPIGKERKTAGCIGIHESLTLWLDTPFASRSKAVKILPSMLDVQLPFPLEECCYCFVQFRKKTAQTLSVLAVASRRAAVQKRINAYQAAGIDPMIIDHEGLALWHQSLLENPPQPESNRVLINLEPDHIALVIGSENYFINAHSLQISTGSNAEITSGEMLNRIQRILRAELPPRAAVPPAKTSGWPTAGNVANFSANLSHVATERAKQKTEWMFCGLLAKQSNIVNSLYNLLQGEWPGQCTAHKAPESFLPRALSTRALERRDDQCNLRQNELMHSTLRAETKRRLTHTLSLFLLTGLLMIAFNLAWQIIASLQFRNAQKAIARLTGEIVPERAVTYGREVVEVQPIIQKRLTDFAPVLNVFNQPLPIRLAGIINAGREADLNYTRLELSRDKILINGTTEDWDYCDHLVKYIQALGYKTEIERQEAEDDNGVRFAVKGNI